MTDARAPHCCIMNVQLEIHEVDKTGQCSGKILTSKELEEAGLKSKLILRVLGYNKQDCLKKLKKVVDELK